MADFRQRDEWDRWSVLLSEIANHNWSRRKPTTPSEFNPFTKRAARETSQMFTIDDYKKAFLKMFPPKDEKQK